MMELTKQLTQAFSKMVTKKRTFTKDDVLALTGTDFVGEYQATMLINGAKARQHITSNGKNTFSVLVR